MPTWVLLAAIAASLLVVGGTRDTGPQTPGDRVDEITKRLACPVCNGESVFNSQNNASRNIRTEVEGLVRANDLSDEEIIAFFDSRSKAEVLLVPRASGLEALAWLIPVFALASGVAGLTFAFSRWRKESALLANATSADHDLVAAAFAAEQVRAVDSDPDGETTAR